MFTASFPAARTGCYKQWLACSAAESASARLSKELAEDIRGDHSSISLLGGVLLHVLSFLTSFSVCHRCIAAFYCNTGGRYKNNGFHLLCYSFASGCWVADYLLSSAWCPVTYASCSHIYLCPLWHVLTLLLWYAAQVHSLQISWMNCLTALTRQEHKSVRQSISRWAQRGLVKGWLCC